MLFVYTSIQKKKRFLWMGMSFSDGCEYWNARTTIYLPASRGNRISQCSLQWWPCFLSNRTKEQLPQWVWMHSVNWTPHNLTRKRRLLSAKKCGNLPICSYFQKYFTFAICLNKGTQTQKYSNGIEANIHCIASWECLTQHKTNSPAKLCSRKWLLASDVIVKKIIIAFIICAHGLAAVEQNLGIFFPQGITFRVQCF